MMTFDQFVRTPQPFRDFILTCAYLPTAFGHLGVALQSFSDACHVIEKQAHERDPGLAEAIRFEREYFNPDAGWLDIAAAREGGRVQHPLIRSAR